jgi:general stress protein 26
MTDQKTHDESVATVRQLIGGIKVCMLTTIGEDGNLQSRPMATLESDPDGTLWFFTSTSGMKSEDIRRDKHVNLSYADPDDNRYVSISGTASLVQDKEKERQLWNPLFAVWFPKGADDPELALLRVDIQKAEYWDSPGGKMVLLAGFIKALTTHEKFSPGEHERVQM